MNPLTPLFPDNHTRNFAVGTPTNEQRVWVNAHTWGECLVEADYSGANPEIQFPEGFHILAGGGGLAGGFHQGRPLSPDKVKVVSFTPPNGQTRNAIRLMGKQSEDDETGVGVCSRFIEPNFLWQPNAQFEYRFKVLFPTTGLGVYCNCELRGNPSFTGKNEVTELIGVHFMSDHLMMKWWCIDQKDDANANEQLVLKLPHILIRDAVYTVVILLTCTNRQSEWQAHVTVGVKGEVVWEKITDGTNSPSAHSSIGMDVFGVERGRVISGTAYVLLAKPSVYMPAA